MISLTVNGKRRELKGQTPLPSFLEELGIDSQFYAVAYNGEVLTKGEYQRVTLKEGDSLEIVRPVGGG